MPKPTKPIRKTKLKCEPKRDGLEVWRTVAGWRWRWWSKGRITAESGEAYKRRGTAIRSFVNMVGDASKYVMPAAKSCVGNA